MEISDLEQLVEMVRGANVGELTVRHGSERVTIRKAPRSLTTHDTVLVQSDDDYVYTTEYVGASEEAWDPEPEEEISLVTAPLVGVFGHVKPVAGLNARVTKGQVIGIIEAMKIMTEITAPVNGTITDVLIEDGHPVEYGQILFEIRPFSLDN